MAGRRSFLSHGLRADRFQPESALAHREAVKYKLDTLAEHQPETIQEACELLQETASAIQSSLGEPYADDRLYSAILDFVHKNYNDDNLSLSMVADKLSLTAPYVTRYFKARNGMPLMQYVSKVRIEKAKELLLNSDIAIKEIVEKIGFVDENNFSRAFKKREGISPTKYRGIYQNKPANA
jgi:two-component system response regulator YesN